MVEFMAARMATEPAPRGRENEMVMSIADVRAREEGMLIQTEPTNNRPCDICERYTGAGLSNDGLFRCVACMAVYMRQTFRSVWR